MRWKIPQESSDTSEATSHRPQNVGLDSLRGANLASKRQCSSSNARQLLATTRSGHSVNTLSGSAERLTAGLAFSFGCEVGFIGSGTVRAFAWFLHHTVPWPLALLSSAAEPSLLRRPATWSVFSTLPVLGALGLCSSRSVSGVTRALAEGAALSCTRRLHADNSKTVTFSLQTH